MIEKYIKSAMYFLLCTLLLFIFMIASSTTAWAVTETLYPSDDVVNHSNNMVGAAEDNYDGTTLSIGRNMIDWSLSYQKVAMKFDLSSIPEGAVITSATLKIYVIDHSGAAKIKLISAGDEWSEITSTFPTYDISNVINGYSDYTVTHDGYNDFNVIGYVNQEFTGNKAATFVFLGIEGAEAGTNDEINIYADENGSNRPELVVTYTTSTATIVATTGMTEGNLDTNSIDVTLNGETFLNGTLDSANFTLNNAPAGLTIESVTYTNSTQCKVNLAYNGTDFDSNITNLGITIKGAELNGASDLTASNQLTITATDDPESISISDDGNITEGSENGEKITVDLIGGTFVGSINPVNWTVSNLPTGVSKGTVTRVSATRVEITLTGNATSDYDTNISNITVICPASDYADSTGGASLSDNSGVTLIANTEPTVSTDAHAALVTSTTATIGGNVTSNGGLTLTARGIEYKKHTAGSYTQEPAATNGTGNFSINLIGLNPATIYDVRAYATNAEGTSYGDVVNFTTTNTNPTISDITDKTTNEDTPITISFTIGDAETAAGNLSISATSNNTTLIPNTGYSDGGSGANRTLTITPALNQYGTATVTVTVDDGSGATAQDTFVLTVNPVNDAPVLAAASPVLTPIDEDSTNNAGNLVAEILGATMSDVDSGAKQGIAIISTSVASGSGTWQYSTNNGGTWTSIEAVADNNALLLRDIDKVRFVPDGQNLAVSSITYRAWDGTSGTQGNKVDATVNGGTSALSTSSNTANITVAAVNDAPTLLGITPTLASICADNISNVGQTVASFIGASITDVDSGAVEGIAITTLTSGNGTWQYSTDNGSTWAAIGSVAGNSALLLRDTDKIRFMPNGQDPTTASITYRAWDRTAGSQGNKVDTTTNGGITAFSTATDTASITVSKLPPRIQTVSVPSNMIYKAGDNLDFTVNFNENVNVTGIPQLILTIGSTTRTADYRYGTGTSAVVFRYTIQAGDNDSDGIAVNELELNGGTIKDIATNDATLTLNGVGSTAEVKIDAVAPTVQTVAVPSNGSYKSGENLNFTVNFSEAVTITGTPQLSLTIGSLAKTATYVSGSGTSALVFRYTVQAGDNDNNGIAINGLELNGGTIKDSATNAATLTLNGVGTTAEVKVDAVAPTVQTVTAPSNGSYKSGENLDFTVNFSEAVTVTGIPELSLTIGSVTRTATYISGTGTSSLVFRYTAQAGDNDNDGIAVTGLELNGGTIKDSVTNDVTLTLNGVASTTEVKVDTVVPTVQTVAVPSNGTYKTGGNLDFTVNFSEGVTVTGTPQLSLDIGGVTRKATYFSGSGTSALVFRYTVQAGDIDYNGILVGGLDLNEGRIKDSATNDATLTLNGVESTAEVKVDATAPTVQSVSVPSNGTYKAGENLDFIVNFSEGVTVTGTPQLSLNIGGVTRNATYFSGTGTTALVFRYTLQAGDNDNDGIAVNGLELSGGTIKDSAGNDATLTLNSVGTATDVKVDTLLPSIGSATLEGNNAFIDITFSEGIYGANDGITALTADKLALTFTKNTGTATAVTISSIKRNDNTAEGSASVLTGGETTIRVFLNITGIPNGAETIEIKPANASAVYDKAGNAVLISQTTEVKTLNDKAVPAFDPATGTSLDTTHKILTLTFNENVVNALGNLDALKGAITFATDGTNYNALGTNDSVAIVNGKLVITFENVLVGNTSKIQIAGSSLKDNHDNVITGSITTNAIIANTAPAAPTGVTATAGNGSATISFTAPVDNGGSAIASYTVTSSPGSITATGNGSPIRITGLTNGVSYTFIVTATNAIGTGLPSVASNSVTPTAPYIPPSGGGGGSQPNTEPKQEQITVDVTDGTTDNVVSETVIQRTTEADGTKKDEVQYTSDKAQETVGKLKEEGKDTARIVIPDAKDEVSEAKIKIPTTTLTVMAQGNISLEIDTENARINIPKGSIKSLDGGLKEDLFFRVVPIKEEHQKREVIERAKQEKIVKQVAKDSDISVVGRPMTIETNMSQREVDIVLPLKDITIPEDPKEREEFFSKIGIFIEHSDGEKVLTKGEVVEYKKGVLGIKFRINKFSTFTIIKLNQGEFDEDGNISSNDGYGGPKTFMQDKEITITFNKDLNEKSLTKESIYVEDSKGNKVETVLKYNHAEKTVIIAPLKYYKTGEIYYLYVTDKLLSASGKTVSKKIKYGFNISNINLDKALKFEEYKEVSGNKAWTVKLNQPIDKSKFKNSDIKVYDEECNEVEVVSTIVDNKTIKVTPKKTYSKGESYYLLIDGLISDKGTGLKKVQWIKYIISDK